eukprot:scaffold15146_cov72-Phaeocystis_antarctica.AAC.2
MSTLRAAGDGGADNALTARSSSREITPLIGRHKPQALVQSTRLPSAARASSSESGGLSCAVRLGARGTAPA